MRTIRLLSERQTVREINRRIRMIPYRFRAGEKRHEMSAKIWTILLENKLFYIDEPLYRNDEVLDACRAAVARCRIDDSIRERSREEHSLEGCNPSSGTLDPARVASAIEEASMGRLRFVSREKNGMRIGTRRLPPCSPDEAREVLHGNPDRPGEFNNDLKWVPVPLTDEQERIQSAETLRLRLMPKAKRLAEQNPDRAAD